MYTPMNKIDTKLYELFARKELSEGCKVNVTYLYYKLSESQLLELRNKYGKCLLHSDMNNDDNDFFNLSFNRDELVKEREINYEATIIKDLDVFKQVMVSDVGHSPHLVQTHIHNIINDSGKLSILFEDYTFSIYEVSEIIGHEPQLHDVFRVAKEKGWFTDLDSELCYLGFYIKDMFGDQDGKGDTLYKPTLSLMNQTDETKLAIIKLFTND